MSVLDEFRDVEQRVVQRLKELEPAVAEYRELEEVAARIGIKTPQSDGRDRQSAPVATRSRTRRATAKQATGGQPAAPAAARRAGGARRGAAAGEREQQMLALVRERPGITVAEVAQALGVDATGLYRIVRRLEQRRELRKRGRQLEPAGEARSSA